MIYGKFSSSLESTAVYARPLDGRVLTSLDSPALTPTTLPTSVEIERRLQPVSASVICKYVVNCKYVVCTTHSNEFKLTLRDFGV